MFFRAVILSALLAFPVMAEVKIPPLSSAVIDASGVLSPKDRESLESLLRTFPPLVQEQIWIIPSLEDEAIESLSIRATDQWKLGEAKKDNGVLILLAVKDRRMRLEVGRGLEGDIPDALAGRIIQYYAAPYFKEGDYAGGLAATAVAIYEKAGGKELRIPKEHRRRSDLSMIFFLIFFGGFWLLRLIFGLFGIRSGGPGGLPLGGGGWSSGSGWSGGGGGWSGGGGGFSGGGASGSW